MKYLEKLFKTAYKKHTGERADFTVNKLGIPRSQASVTGYGLWLECYSAENLVVQPK